LRVLLVAYDNGSYTHWFPQGLGYIATALRKDHEVTIYNQDLHHYPDSHLTDYLNKHRFDMVGVGVCGGYYQHQKLISISKAINESNQRPHYVIGGHGPSPEPQYFLDQTGADRVIIGEAENAIINSEEPVNIDAFPAYDLFPMEYYRLLRMPHCKPTDFVMPILSGRGCPFQCTFCYRMTNGIRLRSTESIVGEVKLLKRNYGITYIAFADELLMTGPQRTIEICEALLPLDIKWDCNGRLNYASPKILKLMKRSGCVFINYGIESLDNQVLENYNKKLTEQQIINGVEATLKSGISPGLNIIFGGIGDTAETLNKSVDFLLKYDDCTQMRTIRPVTPYPGSPLYDTAIERGLLTGPEDFYTKHTNSDLLSVNFTNLTDSVFHQSLLIANTKLINNYFINKKRYMTKQSVDLYLNNNTNFRGYRQS